MRKNLPKLVLFLAVLLPTIARAKTWEVASDTAFTNALTNATNGDRIHVHGPASYTAPSGGWIIKKSIEVFGDGRGVGFSDSATVLKAATANDPVLVLNPNFTNYGLQNVYIHDFQIRGKWNGRGSGSSNGNGIVFNSRNPNKLISQPRLERLHVNDCANDGLHFVAANSGAGAVIGLHVNDVLSGHNFGYGLRLANATVSEVFQSAFFLNGQGGARITGCDEPHIINSTFEGNGTNAGGDVFNPQLFIETGHAFEILGCHFESFAQGNVKTAVTVVNSWGGRIGANTFGIGNGRGSKGIWISAGSPNGPVNSINIQTNMYAGVDTLVKIDDNPYVTGCIVEPQSVWWGSSAARMLIPESADRGHFVFPAARTSAKGSPRFNLTTGLEFPRIKASLRDSLTAPSSGGNLREGLLIYNDDAKRLNYYNGTGWRTLYPDSYYPKTTSANAAPGAVNVPVLTTTERNNLPSVTAGMLIFNSTTSELNYYSGSAWRAVANKEP